MKAFLASFVGFLVVLLLIPSGSAARPKFRVLAFYTAKNDQAHISYVAEARKWFPEAAKKHNFLFEATSNWELMQDEYLANIDIIVFLDTRPENPDHRSAFERFVRNGGGWIGFHFAAFALSPSAYPQNWDWYHENFLGSGQYASNTWRPTPAILQVEDNSHPIVRKLPKTFSSAPNEWYRWANDLRLNPDISILASIHPSSFPLGTGPKAHEIWHQGYYPVVWTNRKFKMVYFNMGHNDIDYEHKFDNSNRTLSFTFENKYQTLMIINALNWMGKRAKAAGDKG